jgi:hypothetical protein
MKLLLSVLENLWNTDNISPEKNMMFAPKYAMVALILSGTEDEVCFLAVDGRC